MPVLVELTKVQYSNTIRMLKRADILTVESVRAVTYLALKRLGVKRDPSKAAKKIPHGSDQENTGDLVAWLNRVSAKDKKAIKQVVAIDATAVARMG